MKNRPDLDFNVRWLPFQLNPGASETPSSKVEAYMKKFGKNKEECMAMGAWMGGNFKKVDLPFNFTEKALISNTISGHRLLTAAYQEGGAEAQDKAVEVLFHSYFADEKAPNDPEVLRKAAEAAGIDGEKIVGSSDYALKETRDELQIGQRMGVSGVPHFVIKTEAGKEASLSGAQPPAEFEDLFRKVAKAGGGTGCR